MAITTINARDVEKIDRTLESSPDALLRKQWLLVEEADPDPDWPHLEAWLREKRTECVLSEIAHRVQPFEVG